MTSANALEGQPAAPESAVPSNGFQGITGAGRSKAALSERAKESAFQRGNHELIDPDAKNQNVLKDVHPQTLF